MKLLELNAKLDLFRREVRNLELIKVACRTCNHWQQGTCQKFNSTPPDDVKLVGCEGWEFDDIPF